MGDTRHEEEEEEEEVVKMAARDQPRSHSNNGMEGLLEWCFGWREGGERGLISPCGVERMAPPSLKPWSIPILQASHVPAGAIAIASFPALVEIAAGCIVSSAWG